MALECMPACLQPIDHQLHERDAVFEILLRRLPDGSGDRDVDVMVLVRLGTDELGNLAWREAEIGMDFAFQRLLGSAIGAVAGIADQSIPEPA
ncbi:hypothetical protein [Microvirga sp. 17 mud 1-3]|uniref:hypothetical protein n=1 Tax=Microvirga sp. 17 mud 1-3 TaxID=2082949 RepID=UPI000D6B1E15|nr:hypothetical protein [Microvirga sp. 17 mud 1-3]AWM87132.1 hypothetical protein C4E04_10560 [Microvirga sp. 17 mud 1-3]